MPGIVLNALYGVDARDYSSEEKQPHIYNHTPIYTHNSPTNVIKLKK